MIELPKSGIIKLGTLIKWNSHTQEDFNKLDKRMLDWISFYASDYIKRITKHNTKINYNTLKHLAKLQLKLEQALKFNNYS
jgi:hypothetical protein